MRALLTCRCGSKLRRIHHRSFINRCIVEVNTCMREQERDELRTSPTSEEARSTNLERTAIKARFLKVLKVPYSGF